MNRILCGLLFLIGLSKAAYGFTPPIAAAATTTVAPNGATTKETQQTNLELKDVVKTVAVAGATGRTGVLVVEELLNRGVPNVLALVRDEKTSQERFPEPPQNLQIKKCDLNSEREMRKVLKDVDAVIWCATGFSQKKNANPIEKIKGIAELALKRTIDVIALPNIAKQVKLNEEQKQQKEQFGNLPRVVMLSSAGVTRPSWDEKKKALMPGAADIPIVRLNPFGALDVKRESEEKLRETGVSYSIVRPCGLNDKHPAGSRPLFTQGDVAVGRINRKDVAKVLVDCLVTPEATGRTFEVIAVAGYQPPASIGSALSNLRTDEEGLPPLDAILSTYTTLQQLLPGETQDSAALAMGQSYEQLDKGEEGRFGPRGKENAEQAAPKPTSHK